MLAGGAGWLGTPEETEITIGSSSLSQLTVRSLLLSFPSHSHTSSSPADTEPSCSHMGLTRGRAEPRPLTQAAAASQEQCSARLQHLPGGRNAVQAGEGTALLHVAKSQLPQATSFCAPWTGVRLYQRSWGSHVALRARQTRIGTQLSPCPRGAAVCPACLCPGLGQLPGGAQRPGASRRMQRRLPTSSGRGETKGVSPSVLLPLAADQAQGRDAALASGGSWRAGERASTTMARPSHSTGRGSLPTSFPAAASSCDSQPCRTGSPQARFKLRRKQNSQWELPPPAPS